MGKLGINARQRSVNSNPHKHKDKTEMQDLWEKDVITGVEHDRFFKVQPFLKWAGGKSQLLPELIKHILGFFEPGADV
jgi:hypothetical protein